jgi:ABC-type ATPase involved in cell division
MSAILADELVKTYPGDVRALDGLSFSVPDGSVFGLLGPNGAGKTTAVKILTTLSRADAGRAEVAGFDVVRNAADVRRSIGVVGQRHGVDTALTGRENLRLQGRVYGMGGKELEVARRRCSTSSASPKRETGSPVATPAACSGGSTSRWRSSTGLVSSSSTSRRRVSIPRCALRCGRRSSGSPRPRDSRFC